MKCTRRDFMKRSAAAALLNTPFGLGRHLFAADKSAPDRLVWVEAEGFSNPGGWSVDDQFMDLMGSPYLLAHGIDTPVADATTSVKFPAAGKYRLWVRTQDWVAKWQAPGTPGKFQLLIDGKASPVTFGTEGADWHWQDGGQVEIPSTQVTLSLHDLTGFGGRCDAIAFSAVPDLVLPKDGPELAELRRQASGLSQEPENGGEFELVVVGGGIAGVCAAISAARLGAKVAFVQDRLVVGGNNSSEVRVWLNGNINQKPYVHVGDLVKELDQRKRAHAGDGNIAAIYEDERKLALLKDEKNLTLFLGYHGNGVEMQSGKIRAVVVQEIRSGKRLRLTGRWFADCTGDGAVGALAGAEFEMTAKGHMGPSNLWNVKDTGAPVEFPRCSWALDLTDKPFPGRAGHNAQWTKTELGNLGQWFWECGFDWDPIKEVEQMRDWNLRAMYGAWDALKNVDKVYPNYKLNWVAYVSGRRESRRLLGDVVLSKEDLAQNRKFEDACFPCTWGLDLHRGYERFSKGFEGREFISYSWDAGKFPKPYWAPYRSLYSRNIPNLFMAGRDISVTHEALGTTRVMRTCGMMGEVVGMAVSLCRKHETDPRGVYEKHLAELIKLMESGVGKAKA